MLRHFYLLCLLVCIECSFCYEYISEADSNHRSIGRDKLGHRRKNAVRGKRHEDEDAHIDIASFIQPEPEYDNIDDSQLYENNYKRNKISREYGEYNSLQDLQLSNDELGNSNSYDKSLNVYGGEIPNISNWIQKNGHTKTSSTSTLKQTNENNNPLHKTEKKCCNHQVKFPFFSRKKSSTSKPKKNKKRKLFNFHRRSKTTEHTTSLPKSLTTILKLNKRDTNEDYCPLCKRKIITKVKNKLDNRNKPSKIIHNSRQYFQEAGDFKKKQFKEAVRINDSDGELDDSCYKENRNNIRLRTHLRGKRRKRGQDSDRERQLKELDEVQRKIDSVEISSRSYQKG